MKGLTEQLEMLPLVLKGRYSEESVKIIVTAVNNYDKMKDALQKVHMIAIQRDGPFYGLTTLYKDVEQLLESLK